MFIITLLTPLYACNTVSDDSIDSENKQEIIASISNMQDDIPLMIGSSESTLLSVNVQASSPSIFTIRKIRFSLIGTTNLADIQNLKLIYTGDTQSSQSVRQFGEAKAAENTVEFNDNLTVSNHRASFKLLVQLKNNINLANRFNAVCESVVTDEGVIEKIELNEADGMHAGIALRRHGDDGVDTYRIPGLTTTKNGTLLAIYDVRRDSSRDLQGDIDIGVSRSTDGGNTWEPMLIALDRGKWGDLPEKFNGISDACILVDENTNAIFVAGLWMYGVLDENGKWVEGLKESSTNWNHQWRNKATQPGFDVKQTCQFLITKSTDDGKTWSEPVNLTATCKMEEWWLWAPAPGHGITLKDGTLVFPTQGRDKNGTSFSNITWSRDGGETWLTSNPASSGTTENMVVELSDGSIMLNARDGKNKGNLSSANGRVISVTHDLGESWTVHSTSRGVLIEPGCMASLHKHFYTENGQRKSLLVFSNPNSKSNRDHMTVKVSFDDGKTWPEKYWKLLDSGKGRGYSCLTSIDEQHVGILYEGSLADMMFQKISLSDLLNK